MANNNNTTTSLNLHFIQVLYLKVLNSFGDQICPQILINSLYTKESVDLRDFSVLHGSRSQLSKSLTEVSSVEGSTFQGLWFGHKLLNP